MTTISKSRISSIDLLRGIIMVIMALDHTRDFFHDQAMLDDPLNVLTTTPVLYATRWITHLCAPTFVFLSGISIWLQSQRKNKQELSRFLITRGLWLVLMDLTIITLGTTSNYHFEFFVIQTLWAIGISMFIMGFMIKLPFRAVLVIGLLIVLGHNSLDWIEAQQKDLPFLWHLMHQQGAFSLWGSHKLFIFYPFLPWSGLMMLGYCCGTIFTRYDETQRSKLLLRLGLGIVVFFVLLRFTNLYGDPLHWSSKRNTLYSFLSFMNVQKYPPSLLYMCATIAPGLIFLALVKNTKGALARFFIVFGRVPMFYYVLHFYTLAVISDTIFFLRGHTLDQGLKGVEGFPYKFVLPGEGFSLGVVYLIWIAVVVSLYPLCKRYDRYKSTHPEKKWLSYL
jgi:uncharacterized membrane protein